MNKVIGTAVSRKTDKSNGHCLLGRTQFRGCAWVCGHFYDRKWADQGDQHASQNGHGVIALHTKRPPRCLSQQQLYEENL